MFVCAECGYVFDEPEKWVEEHGERMSGCPACGGNFDDAKKCELCGEEYSTNLSTQGDLCCEKCSSVIEETFENLLHSNFTEYEISILNSIYEGKDFK